MLTLFTLISLALPLRAYAQVKGEAAAAALAADYDTIVEELITITEIPAPPFKEDERGAWMMARFTDLGLENVARDAVGNITGVRRGTAPSGGKMLALTAHLDTVFPEGTEVKVRREGDRLMAPGIGDDSLGLSAMLAWLRGMNDANITTRNPILFVATVGEEGKGDLRGVRHLLTQGPYKNRIGGFISVDGSHTNRIVHRAVGSKRYRIAFKGPGGHSYGAYGIVNPMAAMADTVRRLYEVSVPRDPKTTYAASVVSGGRSINTIPDEILLEVDMRSPDPVELERLETRFLQIVGEAVTTENFARNTREGEITAVKTRIGDRPAGITAADDPLVKAAQSALENAGYTVELESSSTDSNIAMSLQIPAITIGTGADGGRAHALDEYLNVERGEFVRGLSAGLSIVMDAANIEYPNGE